MDHTFADESYAYFLSEAQDLLTSIEQDLLSLRSDRSPAKIHSLMRAAHTLKGASASVDRHAIKTVAHALEDIFKALYNPAIALDDEIEAFLFEGYDCLRSLLTAEYTGGNINESDALNRVASVIAQLQEKLGDCFNQDSPIPTSAELGFDLVESMFQTGVEKRLETLQAQLDAGAPGPLQAELQMQAEVFLGLAESLNLPGFGAIAQLTLEALQAHPDQVLTLAQVALNDFVQGKTAVLEGDRTQGGAPSPRLRELADATPGAFSPDLLEELLQANPVEADEPQSPPEARAAHPDPGTVDDSTLEWLLDQALPSESSPATAQPSETPAKPAMLPSPPEAEPFGLQPWPPEEHPVGAIASPTPEVQTLNPPQPLASPGIRVSIAQLEQFAHTTSEIQICHTRQTSETDQLRQILQELSSQLSKHLYTVGDLREWSDQITRTARVAAPLVQAMHQRGWATPSGGTVLRHGLDTLEMDEYNDLHLLTQEAQDEAFQLKVLADSIEQHLKQSQRVLHLQHRLLKDLQDDLTNTRMQPLGNLFSRFPKVLHQLTVSYGKQVELTLQGSEVLVDKLIVERLYDPILHLIRNAFDHGIETLEERRRLGKPDIGRIELRAFNQGSHTVIEVRDDGMGVNHQQVVQRATDLGLISPQQAQELPPQAIADLLFHPGFSTASRLTDLSGRGVGLDVVRSQIQMLQGQVTMQSTPHQGTRFSLALPFSLTIRQLLLFQSDQQVYAIPVDTVERIILPQTQQLEYLPNQCLVLHWNSGSTPEAVRVHRLSELLRYPSHRPRLPAATIGRSPLQPPHPTVPHDSAAIATAPIVLFRTPTGLRALQVEALMGEQELVIRPFNRTAHPPAYLHGCCILGSNQLALVIDPMSLLDQSPTGQDVANTPDYHLSPSLPLPPSPIELTNRSALMGVAPKGDSADDPPTLLVVDDSITLRHNLSHVLRQAGYQVLQASDGLEAIDCLASHPQTTAVICDVEMPRLNGFQFLVESRNRLKTIHVPVLMLTSRSSPKHRQIALELGAAAYLTKPYNPQQLLSLLHKLINAVPLSLP